MTENVTSKTKAEILVEALPFIRSFWQKIVVIKYGGSTMESTSEPIAGVNQSSLSSFASDIVLMRTVGMLPVVVHGGGPQIGELMKKLGKQPEFVEGLRVTDQETLDIVRMVLVGKINRDIVGAINVHDPMAVGLSGEDARLITAQIHLEELGFVGKVDKVNPTIVSQLLERGLIPVVATIGADVQGQAYNINADSAASALAVALNAEKLVYLTDVEGILTDLGDPNSLLRSATAKEIKQMVDSGIIAKGMLPKSLSALSAIEGGVRQVHILDGRVAHALLLEIFTREGLGTMISNE
ncbi:MAG: acetylglutamate kinase [Actinobacteria bacterium]|nr:acetylglutamate kinase [Actinomycetota bacterium]MCL6104092.1 acetylglutamate kinase [Actinomycetota bacterium]